MESSVIAQLLFLSLVAELQLTRSQSGMFEQGYPGSYPLVSFGTDSGDALVPPEDDGSGPPLNFTTPFPYLGTTERVIFVSSRAQSTLQEVKPLEQIEVNTNGILSFRNSYTEYVQRPFSLITDLALIAPFWGDVDIVFFGSIYYRISINGTEFLKLQEIITTIFGVTRFETGELVVATYHRVASIYGGPEENSFQVVLASDGRMSFVFLSYGAIQWGSGANIGFNSGNRSYMLPGALSPATLEIEDSSNVGLPGLYVYRVDQESVIHPTQLICQGSIEDIFRGDITPVPILSTLGNCLVAITPSKESPVLLGDYLVLTCRVINASNAFYQFNWLHQDNLIPDETTPTLVLPLVTRRELGVYHCRVSNGTAMGSASINVTAEVPTPRGFYGGDTASCPSQDTRDAITRETFQLLVEEFGARPYGRLRAFPATSCQEISRAHPELGAGLYWISEDGGEPVLTECN